MHAVLPVKGACPILGVIVSVCGISGVKRGPAPPQQCCLSGSSRSGEHQSSQRAASAASKLPLPSVSAPAQLLQRQRAVLRGRAALTNMLTLRLRFSRNTSARPARNHLLPSCSAEVLLLASGANASGTHLVAFPDSGFPALSHSCTFRFLLYFYIFFFIY